MNKPKRLTMDDLVKSTKRIHAFFPRTTPAEIADYNRALLEQVRWMEAARFDVVCIAVAGSMNGYGLPTPDKYIALYHTLASEQGWKRNQGDGKCPTCGGSGFVQAQVVTSAMFGYQTSTLAGCPMCNPKAAAWTGPKKYASSGPQGDPVPMNVAIDRAKLAANDT